MGTSNRERDRFLDGYTRALVASWSGEDFDERLARDPRGTLAEVGLLLPDAAQVEIVRELDPGSADGGLDQQVTLWERGCRTGHFVLHFPAAPTVSAVELDLDDLAEVSGGGLCCCPCSSCA